MRKKTHSGRKEHTSGAKAQTIFKDLSARLNRLRKNSVVKGFVTGQDISHADKPIG